MNFGKKFLHFFLIFHCYCSLLNGSYKIHLSSAWYPNKKTSLLFALEKYDQQAKETYDFLLDGSKIRALIVPHAGYQYSGVIAASAYRLLKPNFFKRVIVLAPAHFEYFKGIGLPSKHFFSYKNILGDILLDRKVLDYFALEPDLFSYQVLAHEQDHAINVQLPFIQYYLGKQCLLIPLLIGELSEQQLERAIFMLRPFLNENTLVIVSSDFTHYGSRFLYEPFKGQENINQSIFALDSSIVWEIQNGSLAAFTTILHKTGATVCGKNPLRLLLGLMQAKSFGVAQPYVIGYETSAFLEKNPDHSVSYLSCVISNQLKKDLAIENRLTGYEKKFLLQLARQHLVSLVEKKDNTMSLPGIVTKSLKEPSGAFVTLYKNNQLRGCIGSLNGTMPLYETIFEMTKSAALHDGRFSPVEKDELPLIDISLSVLTPLEKIASYHDIQIGRDGVLLKKQQQSATYLPKVAIEQGWNLEEMLQSLSEKAGLAPGDWKSKDAQYQIYQSIDFSEKR